MNRGCSRSKLIGAVKATVVLTVLTCTVSLTSVVYAEGRLQQRSQQWNSMSPEEQEAAKAEAQQQADEASEKAQSTAESVTPEQKEAAKAEAESRAQQRATQRQQRYNQ